MKIAVYPGTFDPPHAGHAMVASYVAQFTDVDEVWMMPSGLNPLKRGSLPSSSDSARMEMVRLTAAPLPGVTASDFELSLPRPTYTYVTLCRLREKYPQHSFTLVVGSDNWLCFSRWRNTDRILSEFGVIVYPRPGYEVGGETVHPNALMLQDAPLALISSSFIREIIAGGHSAAGFVAPDVAAYLAKM